ncbi:unnamed protein product [Amoebophrya sp. A120]|nr:unnamed protein product [Amoebophrya sp. A120]|eukprot:GSA120T00013543001.1
MRMMKFCLLLASYHQGGGGGPLFAGAVWDRLFGREDEDGFLGPAHDVPAPREQKKDLTLSGGESSTFATTSSSATTSSFAGDEHKTSSSPSLLTTDAQAAAASLPGAHDQKMLKKYRLRGSKNQHFLEDNAASTTSSQDHDGHNIEMDGFNTAAAGALQTQTTSADKDPADEIENQEQIIAPNTSKENTNPGAAATGKGVLERKSSKHKNHGDHFYTSTTGAKYNEQPAEVQVDGQHQPEAPAAAFLNTRVTSTTVADDDTPPPRPPSHTMLKSKTPPAPASPHSLSTRTTRTTLQPQEVLVGAPVAVLPQHDDINTGSASSSFLGRRCFGDGGGCGGSQQAPPAGAPPPAPRAPGTTPTPKNLNQNQQQSTTPVAVAGAPGLPLAPGGAGGVLSSSGGDPGAPGATRQPLLQSSAAQVPAPAGSATSAQPLLQSSATTAPLAPGPPPGGSLQPPPPEARTMLTTRTSVQQRAEGGLPPPTTTVPSSATTTGAAPLATSATFGDSSTSTALRPPGPPFAPSGGGGAESVYQPGIGPTQRVVGVATGPGAGGSPPLATTTLTAPGAPAPPVPTTTTMTTPSGVVPEGPPPGGDVGTSSGGRGGTTAVDAGPDVEKAPELQPLPVKVLRPEDWSLAEMQNTLPQGDSKAKEMHAEIAKADVRTKILVENVMGWKLSTSPDQPSPEGLSTGATTTGEASDDPKTTTVRVRKCYQDTKIKGVGPSNFIEHFFVTFDLPDGTEWTSEYGPNGGVDTYESRKDNRRLARLSGLSDDTGQAPLDDAAWENFKQQDRDFQARQDEFGVQDWGDYMAAYRALGKQDPAGEAKNQYKSPWLCAFQKGAVQKVAKAWRNDKSTLLQTGISALIEPVWENFEFEVMGLNNGEELKKRLNQLAVATGFVAGEYSALRPYGKNCQTWTNEVANALRTQNDYELNVSQKSRFWPGGSRLRTGKDFSDPEQGPNYLVETRAPELEKKLYAFRVWSAYATRAVSREWTRGKKRRTSRCLPTTVSCSNSGYKKWTLSCRNMDLTRFANGTQTLKSRKFPSKPSAHHPGESVTYILDTKQLLASLSERRSYCSSPRATIFCACDLSLHSL